MSIPILKTKLYVPQPRPNLVSRPRLLQRLEEGLSYKVTLISAPAGFGKTTLLCDWVNQSENAFAWLSLDEGDNDLSHFWSYAIAAIQSIYPGIAESSLARLQSSGFSGTGQKTEIEDLLIELINDIVSQTIEGRAAVEDFFFVLDDYHLITTQAIHDSLLFLLDNLPVKMHLIISTRSDPPLQIPRLRVRGHLIELRVLDLLFTPDEAAAFLNVVMGLELTSEEINLLKSHTEGWIAGLQMVALALQSPRSSEFILSPTSTVTQTGETRNISEFIKYFSGEHPFVLDYLAEEVLNSQTEDIRNFLLITSILDYLTGDLCDAISGLNNSQNILEQLSQSNLFILSLDNQQHWYRYHHLFRDFLKERLIQTQIHNVKVLHQKASNWHQGYGQLEQAIKHAIKAEDFDRTASLIEGISKTGVVISEPSVVLGWLEELPPEIIKSRPELGLSYATTFLSLGNLESVEAYLVDVERVIYEPIRGINDVSHEDIGIFSEVDAAVKSHLEEAQIRDYLGKIAAIRSIVACYQGDASAAVSLSQKALEDLAENDLFWRGVMAINIALNISGIIGSKDRLLDACQILADAAEESKANEDYYTAIYALGRLGDLLRIRGKLRDSVNSYQGAIRLGGSKGQTFPSVGISHVGLGEVLYEWNELENAERHLIEAINLGKKSGDVDVLGEGYISLARVKLAVGDFNGAKETLNQAGKIAQSSNIAWIVGRVSACQTNFWLSQGELKPAIKWGKQSGLNVGGDIGYRRQREYSTLARVYIAQNDIDQALLLLDWIWGVVETNGMTGHKIEILALQALAYQAKGNTSQAVNVLEHALSLAETEGYFRVFVDEGEPMAQLLRKAVSPDVSLDYVGKLLGAMRQEQPKFSPHPEPETGIEPLIEPLSQRELQVLTLIAGGASNREIAEELVLALGTVKKHINNIFGKLNVSSRTQAIARARELNLL